MSRRWGFIGLLGALVTSGLSVAVGQSSNVSATGTFEYQVLATTRTSTMERELNEAAEQGYRFQAVMGGDTSFGGSEVVALVMRGGDATSGRYVYRLLATGQTSTMQEELKEAGGEGFEYRGQTVFESFFGGEEVVVILERDDDAPALQYDYLLLATTRTSTLEEELSEAGQHSYEFMGLTVAETAFGGEEVVVITRRVRPAK
ncbi:MAG: hypothetical protein VYE68_13715 [Acidobacteriota bacterium]|nr:hypothetical protein [Acidobacteriota bacterium]